MLCVLSLCFLRVCVLRVLSWLRVVAGNPRDGGATHALRQAKSEKELELATPISVGLALGERTMYLTHLGT